jgi:hypothetical protein
MRSDFLKLPRRSVIKKQSGVGLLIFFIVLFSVAATVTLSALNNRVASRTSNDNVYPELLEAKEALLAFAMFHTGYSSLSYSNDNGPGRLPCPDTNNNGLPNHGCDGSTQVGRLPIGFRFDPIPTPPAVPEPPEFVFTTREDDSRFWYALSTGFGFRTTTPTPTNRVNSSTEGVLTLNNQDHIVALIIDAGVAIGTQTRPNNNRSSYLEGGNQLGNDFVTVPPTIDEFNDRMVAITEGELRAAMTLRVAQEIRIAISAAAATMPVPTEVTTPAELQAAMTTGPSWYSTEAWSVSELTKDIVTGITTFRFANCNNIIYTITSDYLQLSRSGNLCHGT